MASCQLLRQSRKFWKFGLPLVRSFSIIDVERPQQALLIGTLLMKMVAATKSSPLKIMREYTSLAFGPGRVSFAEYHKLRLFDDAYYAG